MFFLSTFLAHSLDIQLNSSHAEDKVLQLFYAGAALHDTWVCSDLGISSGTTIKSALQDSDKPVLHINCPFNRSLYDECFV